MQVTTLWYPGASFVPRTPPIFGCQTRHLSVANQQWSLWLYIKYLMDMLPRFWITWSSTFGKNSIFHPWQEFSASTFTARNDILYSMYFLRKTVFHFLPREKRSCFWEKNTIFPDNTRKIMCGRVPFWKGHLFRKFEENIIFPCIFKERSSFIFRLRCKIIFSGKGNIIFPNNTRKMIFQHNFFGKTIFSGCLEKENMVFCAVKVEHNATMSNEKQEMYSL